MGGHGCVRTHTCAYHLQVGLTSNSACACERTQAGVRRCPCACWRQRVGVYIRTQVYAHMGGLPGARTYTRTYASAGACGHTYAHERTRDGVLRAATHMSARADGGEHALSGVCAPTDVRKAVYVHIGLRQYARPAAYVRVICAIPRAHMRV